MDQDTKKILQRLEALCSRREYCSRDIYRKALERCGGDIQRADEILESLKAERFVDDLRYASAFAREKSSLSGWGELKLRTALLATGIDTLSGFKNLSKNRSYFKGSTFVMPIAYATILPTPLPRPGPTGIP